MPKKLTAKRLRQLLIYHPRTGNFRRRIASGGQRKGSIAGSINTIGYVAIGVDGGQYYGHRLAILYMTGSWPAHHVDHRNLIRSDNRWKNLRPATSSQNNHHLIRAPGVSGFRGASFHKKLQKWRAKIRVQGKHIHLGLFETPLEAHVAYCAASQKHFGDFSTTGTVRHAP